MFNSLPIYKTRRNGLKNDRGTLENGILASFENIGHDKKVRGSWVRGVGEWLVFKLSGVSILFNTTKLT